MEQTLKTKIKKRKGFTLIELIIVIAIIGILGAIAIPSFLSVKENSKVKADSATKDSIINVTKTLLADETLKTGTTDNMVITITAGDPATAACTAPDGGTYNDAKYEGSLGKIQSPQSSTTTTWTVTITPTGTVTVAP